MDAVEVRKLHVADYERTWWERLRGKERIVGVGRRGQDNGHGATNILSLKIAFAKRANKSKRYEICIFFDWTTYMDLSTTYYRYYMLWSNERRYNLQLCLVYLSRNVLYTLCIASPHHQRQTFFVRCQNVYRKVLSKKSGNVHRIALEMSVETIQ